MTLAELGMMSLSMTRKKTWGKGTLDCEKAR